MVSLITEPAWMEPTLPEENNRGLEDIAFDLISKASSLAGQVNPIVTSAIGNLVRSMNCYYSNLIEGHDTHPRDIERALHKDFSTQPKKRALQLEAVAHIEVQKAIDEGADDPSEPTTATYTLWLHREFCRRLPEGLLWVEDPHTGRRGVSALENCGTARLKWGATFHPPQAPCLDSLHGLRKPTIPNDFRKCAALFLSQPPTTVLCGFIPSTTGTCALLG